jgi:hypothetical protein
VGWPKFGKVELTGRTKEYSRDAGGFTEPKELPYTPSKTMQDLIDVAETFTGADAF